MTIKDDIERLFREHYAAMYRFAMLILREDDVARDEDDVARDIVHDVFEALLLSGRSNISDAYLLVAVQVKQDNAPSVNNSSSSGILQ